MMVVAIVSLFFHFALSSIKPEVKVYDSFFVITAAVYWAGMCRLITAAVYWAGLCRLIVAAVYWAGMCMLITAAVY